MVGTSARELTLACTVDAAQLPHTLHAHVEFEGDLKIHPGDTVMLHGEDMPIGFGDHTVEQRRATIVRAGWLLRSWTKFTEIFRMSELYEVSFSPRRRL
ncbi:MAG: hypothetical protein ACE363_03595 [Alphaproteobacteria bacterium]